LHRKGKWEGQIGNLPNEYEINNRARHGVPLRFLVRQGIAPTGTALLVVVPLPNKPK
jgi:hypothetical protein